jgi:DNA-binding CsgD family transcriptional regulator
MTPGKTQWTDDTTRRLLAMKREGLSKTTIALRLGCSRATVRQKLQEIEQKKTTQENR